MCLLRVFSPFQIGIVHYPNFILIDIMIKKLKNFIFKNSVFLEIKLLKLQLVDLHLIMVLYKQKFM